MSETQPVTEPRRATSAASTQRTRIRDALRAPGGMRQAVLLMEILLGPMALRQSRSGGRSASQ